MIGLRYQTWVIAMKTYLRLLPFWFACSWWPAGQGPSRYSSTAVISHIKIVKVHMIGYIGYQDRVFVFRPSRACTYLRISERICFGVHSLTHISDPWPITTQLYSIKAVGMDFWLFLEWRGCGVSLTSWMFFFSHVFFWQHVQCLLFTMDMC